MVAPAPYFCDAAEHFVGSSASPGDPVYAGARGAAGRVDGPRRRARFHGPRALALDGVMLYVADTGNGALRCIDTRAGVVNTAVTLEDICTIAHVHEFTPSGLACDGDLLAVVDIRNHVVWAYHLRTYRLDLLAGAPGVHGDQDGRADEARFWLPNAVSTSPDGFVVSEARGRRLISHTGDVRTLR